MAEILEKIIDAAIHAPSGDNCQPWEFEITGNQIFLYLLPQRDVSLYSWGQRASILALGAAIENMTIAAANFGYAISTTQFPEQSRPELIASLTVNQTSAKNHSLYDSIFLRCTNRKPYQKTALSPEQKSKLMNISDIGAGQIAIKDSPQDIGALAAAASINEKILFENYSLHKFFYDHIIWTAGDELEKRMGFYVKTLEVPAYAMPGFKLAKSWNAIKFLNKFGFSGIIAKQNAKTYGCSSAIGAVIIPDNSKQSYILAGRLLQSTWLKATQAGLAMQPLTGICFLMQLILGGKTEQLSAPQTQLIKDCYGQMQAIFGSDKQTIALLFRVGCGGDPSARTLRLPAQIKKR